MKPSNYELSDLTYDQLTPLQKIDHPLFSRHDVELFIKREDLVHPLISGNKWYKLKHNLLHARAQGFTRLVSFGGAFSNHLHALAFAGHYFGFETIGYIRGEVSEPLNPTLADAVGWGMRLEPLSRSQYRRRHEIDFVQQLVEPLQRCFVIPEGGANEWALAGCADIVTGISQQLPDYDYVCLPCGTGATLAGVTAALAVSEHAGNVQVLGFSALKGNKSLVGEVSTMLTDFTGADINNWQIIDEFHGGGFAKITPELIAFMQQWYQQTGIALEPLYTGKMLLGLCELVERGFFPAGAKIVAVHTGGMQGIRGMQAKIDKFVTVNS